MAIKELKTYGDVYNSLSEEEKDQVFLAIADLFKPEVKNPIDFLLMGMKTDKKNKK